MPKITDPILSEAHELIRDKIVAILTDEIPSQATLLADTEINATVYKERVVPITYEVCPAINVMLERVKYEGQTQVSSDSECNFIIDVYSKAQTTSSVRGDQETASRAQAICRVIRGILEAPVYKHLDFDSRFIHSRNMNDMTVSEPRDTKDGKHMMLIRMTFTVKATNDNIPQEARALELSEIQMKLSSTDKGHLLETQT